MGWEVVVQEFGAADEEETVGRGDGREAGGGGGEGEEE